MELKNTLYEKTDRTATITINRPEALNAFNKETVEEVLHLLNDAAKDENIRVVVITGAGEKAFSAGADIKAMKDMNSLKARALAKRGHKLCRAIETLGKPVIAAINGYALGGGLEVSMACDFRIASDKAKMGQTEVNIGLIPGWGGTQRLPRLVGKTVAKEMIYTGKMITAQKAEQLGLVNKVVPINQLMSAVKEFASELADKPPVALEIAKSLINRGMETDLETALTFERESFGVVASTKDLKEGVSAFIGKRKPEFKGK
ncbi:MAG: enoyl-CoA hydratase-related protein [Thermoproteota archaeon]|nr:enoyl-CoA hydratase-related protein [Thermoproteota archaeon]